MYTCIACRQRAVVLFSLQARAAERKSIARRRSDWVEREKSIIFSSLWLPPHSSRLRCSSLTCDLDLLLLKRGGSKDVWRSGSCTCIK